MHGPYIKSDKWCGDVTYILRSSHIPALSSTELFQGEGSTLVLSASVVPVDQVRRVDANTMSCVTNTVSLRDQRDPEHGSVPLT